jgi:molybdenum cofactor synthesis domain-containing protein
MTQVTAALLIIGNEILSGRTVDKNLSHLALKLNEIGVQLREARVVPDVEDTIVAAVNALRATYDYVFTTGGIGPTHDDITSAAIAKAFGVKLHRHPHAEKLLRAHYTADQINEARLKMADVPEGAVLLDNPVSSAPGFRVGNVFVMAGVPRIMQAMLDAILPELRGGAPVLTLSVTTNLPEGDIATTLTAIQARYPDIEIGSYPMYSRGEFSTSLVLRSPDGARNEAAAAEIHSMIAAAGGKIVTPVLV